MEPRLIHASQTKTGINTCPEAGTVAGVKFQHELVILNTLTASTEADGGLRAASAHRYPTM
jgi:hypothetical protein